MNALLGEGERKIIRIERQIVEILLSAKSGF
jgi:hypothetical protein